MLQKLREWLVLVLIVLLPFHAFLVTVGTRLLVGPGHAPLPWLAGWKEMLLGVVLVVAVMEIVRSLLVACLSGRQARYSLLVDVLDWLIVGLLVLGFVTSIFHFQFSIFNFALGAKYTLFPLLLFLILRRVPWSEHFLLLTSYFLLFVGAVVAGYGILTLFLPESFFTWLGYSDLHSLYLPDGAIAAFQKIEGTGIRRIQSTFSGPNQLGMWLLIPWSMALVFFRRIKNQVLTSYFLLLEVALFLTFSRAAWIGAAVIVGVLLAPRSSPFVRWKLLVAGCSFFVVLLFVSAMMRPQSTMEHFRRPVEALHVIAAHPLGLGLGSAGPASNRTSDPCVFLEAGTDVSWAKDRPNLCVFSGAVQVQPAGRVCRCPFLPENWYLQVGVELGFLGMLLCTTLVVLVVKKLIFHFPVRGPASASTRHRDEPLRAEWQFSIFHSSAILSFIGISVAALFLHAWEDSAVAYTVWILLAGALPVRRHCIP